MPRMGGGLYLEMEDSCIFFLEALPMGDDAVQEILIQGQGTNSSQEPTVTCGEPEVRTPDPPRPRCIVTIT